MRTRKYVKRCFRLFEEAENRTGKDPERTKLIGQAKKALKQLQSSSKLTKAEVFRCVGEISEALIKVLTRADLV